MEASDSSPQLPVYMRPVPESMLTPQCRELLPSLPAEPSWLNGLFHQYQGYWFETLYIEALLYYRDRQHFQAQDSDIFLVTLPKAGTTWLKAILFALANRTRCHPASPDHPLISNNPHDLLLFMEFMLNPFSQKKITDFFPSNSQRIITTHTPYALLPDSVKESSCKVIYLYRNPKDVFVSSWLFASKLRGNWRSHDSLDKAFDNFCRGVSLGGPYWDNVLGHWKESLSNPQRVMFLKFEDLKQSPVAVIKTIAEFIGCPISKEEESKGMVEDIISLCSLEKLSSLEVNGSTKKIAVIEMDSSAFFRRGEVGDWANYLTPEMVERIDHITEEKFRGSGLSF